MDWNYPYFTKKEMECSCGCGGLPRPEFMEMLVKIREKASFPFIISSGFRCGPYNAKVSDTGINGPHTLGLACDILVFGDRAYRLIYLAIQYGITGIGIQQKGNKMTRFIHLDSIEPGGMHPRPWIWSY